MKVSAFSSRRLVLMGAMVAFAVPVIIARSPQSDLAAHVTSARASLEQALQSLSPAKQRAAADLIKQLGQQIQQAEAQIPVVTKLEADLQQARSRANSLKSRLEEAQGRSDRFQEQLRTMIEQQTADAENFSRYHASILRKWGLQEGQRPTFQMPEEAARSAQYDQDKAEHDARMAALERKWAGMPQFVQQAANAKRAADAAQRAYSDAESDAASFERELESKAADFQSLGQTVGDGLRALGGGGSGGPAFGGGGSVGGGGGVGGGFSGPPMSARPAGSNTSALDQLRATKIDELSRTKGTQRFQGDCYESGCVTTNGDGAIVIPNVSPKAASRLAENDGYKKVTTQVEKSAKAFQEAETTLLKLERSGTAAPAELQQAIQKRNETHGELMRDKFSAATFGLNLAPIAPQKAKPPVEVPSPGRGGRQ